jgi:predicted dehydrogenase
LQHKNHVLCEKPMATTEADCVAMLGAAATADRILAIGMVRRFFPAFAQMKAWIDERVLGDIHGYCYREGKLLDWDVKTPGGFIRKNGCGSGLLFDIGPHALDLLLWLFGVPRVLSYADDALSGVEANVVMDLEAPGGSGSVQLSWDFPLKNELRVLGSKGEAVLRVDQLDALALKKGSSFQQFKILHPFPADTLRPARQTMSPALYTQCIYCQLIQLARAIQLGEAPAVNGEFGRECVRVMELARRHAQPIDMPWLNANQRQAYQTLHWTNS